MSVRTATAVAATCLALSLTACGPGAPEPSPSPSPEPSVSVTASPTPTPEPSPSVTAAPGELDCPGWDDGLDESGIAPIAANRYAGICVDMSFTEASGTFGGPPITGDPYCPWIANVVWVEEYAFIVNAVTEYENPGERIWMFRMAWWGDPADMAGFELPTTAEGITLGSTTAQVLAAFPGGSMVGIEDMSLGPRQQWLAPVNDQYGYIFDVTDGYVSIMYWGERLAGGTNAEICAL